MQHVTFDTAKRLKEAGFPQPMPQVGQSWYQEYTGKLTIIYEVQEGQVYRHNIPPGKGSLSAQCDLAYFLEATIFTPTATDILEQLPTYCLWRNEAGNKWYVGLYTTDGYDSGFQFILEHENPTEACALAWLKLREPKPAVDPNYLPW